MSDAHAKGPRNIGHEGNPFSSLPCPHCGKGPTKVEGSMIKVKIYSTEMRRDRRCMRCNRMFVTYEGYAQTRNRKKQ